MTRGINKVMLIGNLGHNPTIAKNCTKISIATSESYKQDGKDVVKTEWHNITFFGNLAKNAEKYLKKGMKVYIEGKLSTNKYIDKHNIDRIRTEIIASVMQILDPKKDTQEPQNYEVNGNIRDEVSDAIAHRNEEDDINDEDIPF